MWHRPQPDRRTVKQVRAACEATGKPFEIDAHNRVYISAVFIGAVPVGRDPAMVRRLTTRIARA